ncbi:hypothetical protein ACBI99_29335 [Nonomuraea sp. ATR24]|uniref:hypothetical protein n=1 Tax=Nonomuraea TaxID=83681 RepID=UPI001C5D0C22|nr:hypothetical protein [Nonomuraea ceibae]
MISSNMMPATQWLASACRDAVRLADGPAKLRQPKSARRQEMAFYAHAHSGAAAMSAPVRIAGAEVPTQPNTKGGVRGPQPWRDAPVIT